MRGFIPGFIQPLTIIDQLSTLPRIAYSLRLLSLGYQGNCIQVRRSSDNSTKSIGFVPKFINGTLYYVLDTATLLNFCGSGNGFISIWYGQGQINTSNAADMIQATAANQPQIVSSGAVMMQNGQPAIYFGGSQYLTTRQAYADTSGTNPSQNTVVFSPAVLTGYQFISSIGGSGGNNSRTIGTDGSNFIVTTTGNDLITGTPAVGNSYIFSGQFTSTPSEIMFVNGTTISSKSINMSTPTTYAFYMGRSYAYSDYLTGYIQEMLNYNINQSAADMAIYDINSAGFYGISGVTQ